MIPLNFGLWWSGAKLSYLRYLTFKTLRRFHPHSRIQLYTNNNILRGNSTGKGGIEEQEYGDPNGIKIDYMPKLQELGVEIIKTDKFSKYSPNHQSDMFRWHFLTVDGGFYLDTDQIVLQSFKSLPLNCEFIYSSYRVRSSFMPDGMFSPVGVLGAIRSSKIVDQVIKFMPSHYDPNNYNCIGPLMFAKAVNKIDMTRGFNVPSSFFYPAAICDQMGKIFDGSFKFKKENYCVHWFGGYGQSQKFNKGYTEEFAKKSKDSISVFLRENKLV